MDPAPLKLMIVDDHALLRIGLKTSLQMEPGFTVVAEASSGQQALEMYDTHHPDVSLVDLRMPGLNAIDTIHQIRTKFREAKIIVISTFQGGEDIYRALQAGAKAYLPKSIQRDEMISAIRAVAAGEGYLPACVAASLAERLKRANLTSREMEVLRLLSRGESNKEIATALSLAEVTIKLHVGKILEKLGARDRTEAARMAIESGLVWLD
ncbi:MAG TPA: response regulator transcription factor [Opitutaceae bacterium]|nr:response regulator transcription factor [Opitutaceae bacterium]